MARPKKQTVEYFPHFISSGKTLFILEQTYGNDGYAFWFKLLELLGSTNGHVYDCRNAPSWRFLLAKTRVSEVTANEILDTLVELEAIDAELWKQRIIWSDNFVRNLLPVYSNRKADLPKKPVINSINDSTGEFLQVKLEQNGVSTGKNLQSKVKESKVKESKVENSNSTSKENIEVFKYFEKCNFGLLSPMLMEKIATDIEIYGPTWVMKAAEIADEESKHTYSYVKGILENWKAKGRITLKEKKGATKDGSVRQNTETSPYDFSKFGG